MINVMHVHIYLIFQRGNSPLHIAAMHGKIGVVELLLNSGSNVNMVSKVRTHTNMTHINGELYSWNSYSRDSYQFNSY